MTFQPSPLRAVQTTGLAGEIAREGPLRSAPWILNSSGVPNIIGHAFTKVSDGNAQVGGGGVFVGILGRPKEHALVGVGTSSLTPTNVLGDGIVATMVSEAIMFIQLSDVSAQAVAGAVGTLLFFVDATGIISAGTAGGGETQIANAVIVLEDVPDNGLAIVQFSS